MTPAEPLFRRGVLSESDEPAPKVPAYLVALRDDRGEWSRAEVLWRSWHFAFNRPDAGPPRSVVFCEECRGARVGEVRAYDGGLVLGTVDGRGEFSRFRVVDVPGTPVLSDAETNWTASEPGTAGLCRKHSAKDGAAQVCRIAKLTPTAEVAAPASIRV